MSKIAEQKALEEYPIINPPYNTSIEAIENVERAFKRKSYIKCYDQAMQDVFEWIEKNIPCGEMSSEDVRDFIIECKEYFKGED